MKKIIGRLANEPVYAFAVAEAAVGVAIALEVVSAEVGGSVAALMAVLGGGVVRQAVSPVRKLVDGITDAVAGE